MMVHRFALVLLYSAAALAAANAADVPVPIQPPEDAPLKDGWTFAVSSYFWAAGMAGNVGQFGLPPAHLESDFGDILSDLDFAFMGIAEARNDRFSLFGDVIYTKISRSAATPFGIVADHVEVTSETFIGLAGVGYSIFEDDRGYIDLVGRARVWHTNTDLSLVGGLGVLDEYSDGATWGRRDGRFSYPVFPHRHDLSERLGPGRRWSG
jgi:hypothetical protein